MKYFEIEVIVIISQDTNVIVLYVIVYIRYIFVVVYMWSCDCEAAGRLTHADVLLAFRINCFRDKSKQESHQFIHNADMFIYGGCLMTDWHNNH